MANQTALSCFMSAAIDDHQRFMTFAIEVCQTGMQNGQAPFGAAVVRDGVLLAASHNTNAQANLPTRHAEINAIEMACETIGARDLSGCVLYATCEPCPMCFAAAHWAGVARIVFGATIADADAAGFRQLWVSCAAMKSQGKSAILLEGPVMREVCRALLTRCE